MHSSPSLVSLILENSKIDEFHHMQGIYGVNL
jgi:hypothetical protein